MHAVSEDTSQTACRFPTWTGSKQGCAEASSFITSHLVLSVDASLLSGIVRGLANKMLIASIKPFPVQSFDQSYSQKC